MLSASGILILDKPAGISSARAVDAVKRLLPRKTRIGHAGTLDPFATGVLLLLIGQATKRCESLMGQEKEYLATVKLGAFTATDDLEAPPQPVEGAADPGIAAIDALLSWFVGTILQTPPAFSAMKVAGRRAYDLARRGEQVKLEPRPVRIDEIERVSYEWPLLRLRIACGRGTYIRSIARDLGVALGTGAHLTELRRTRIGEYALDRAVTLDTLRADGVTAHLVD
jgi:tRNA pseudouridine55 synthase